jgi:hypothetical protein
MDTRVMISTERKSERGKVGVFRRRSLQWSYPFVTIFFLSISDGRSFHDVRMHCPQGNDVLWLVRMRHERHMHADVIDLKRCSHQTPKVGCSVL